MGSPALRPGSSRFVVGSLVVGVLYVGLAVWAWGDAREFFEHPARLGLVLVQLLLIVATWFSGISGLSSGKREDRANRWIFVPALLVSAAMVWLVPRLDHEEMFLLDGDRARYLGLALFTCGGTIRVAAMFTLGRYFSGLVAIQPDHRLVTRGMYRFLRHPSYLGFLTALAGWALVFRSGIGLLLTASLVWPIVYRIRDEEKLLASEFGAEYETYRQSTWRLVPFIY